jgi:hypothetical protein
MSTPNEMTDEEFKVWFGKNFFDVRKNKPQPGQVLARYRATAHFVDAWVKRNVMDMLLKNKDTGAEMAIKVLRNLCGAIYEDALRVALNITDDFMEGKTVEEVAATEYQMIIEFFFWTEAENIPDDLHWSKIELLSPELDKQIKVAYSEAVTS